ncbi:hypothetical protein, partial [Thermincola ferriacetica]
LLGERFSVKFINNHFLLYIMNKTMKKTLPWILAGAIAASPAFGATKKPAKTGIIPVGAIALLLNKKPTTPVLKEPVDFGQFAENTEITGTVEVTGENTTGTCEAYQLPANTLEATIDLVNTGKVGEYNQLSVPANTGFGLLPADYRMDCVFDNQGKTLNAPGSATFNVYTPTMPVLKGTPPIYFGIFEPNTEITGTLEVTGEKTTGVCDIYHGGTLNYETTINLVNNGKVGDYNQLSMPTNTGFGLTNDGYQLNCIFNNDGKTLSVDDVAEFGIYTP